MIAGSGALVPIFIAAILFDATIFGFTLSKGLSLRRNGFSFPLLHLIIRDGNLYFVAIFLLNFITLVFILADPFNPMLGTINLQISAVVTAILVSRLFLNLKEAAYVSRRNPVSLVNLSELSMFGPEGSSGLLFHRPRTEVPRQSNAIFPKSALWTFMDSASEDLGADLQSQGMTESGSMSSGEEEEY